MKELKKIDYLSKENCNCLKVIFAIAVMISHMFAVRQFGANLGVGPIITSFGYLSVSFFLFFSGYGLTISYIKKGEAYLEGYLKKRVLPLYIINVVLIFVYAVFRYVVGHKFSVSEIIRSFFIGGTVIKYGWYIQTIILFYIIYYIAFRKSLVSKGIIKLTFYISLYCILFAIFKKIDSWWYESSLAFVLGAVWAANKTKIDFLFDNIKNYVVGIVSLLISFAVCFVLGNAGILPPIIRIPIKMISAVLFVSFVLLATRKIKVNYKLTEFLGNYYFEIYILQGFFIILFTEVLVIKNIWLFYCVCILCTVVFAVLVHPAIVWINKKCKGGV